MGSLHLELRPLSCQKKKVSPNITMVQMTETYTRTEEKDYDKFLSKLGVNFMLRKAATISTPNMEITESGGKWKMVTSTSLKSIVLEFELGKEFEEDTTDGRKCKTTVTKEGDNKLITKQKAQKSGQKNVTVIREFTDTGIHVQMICEDVTSVQFFKRN